MFHFKEWNLKEKNTVSLRKKWKYFSRFQYLIIKLNFTSCIFVQINNMFQGVLLDPFMLHLNNIVIGVFYH